jgi:large subunit ribosomal protein L18
MHHLVLKAERRLRRRRHIRRKVFGTQERPRLTVTRSLRHVYAQLIDDVAGVTLAAANTQQKDVAEGLKNGENVAAAKAVGKALAARAKAKGIEQAVFDRNGYLYHGRVKAVADGAREGGLKF